MHRTDQSRTATGGPAQGIQARTELKFALANFFFFFLIIKGVYDIEHSAFIVIEGFGYVADTQRLFWAGEKLQHCKAFIKGWDSFKCGFHFGGRKKTL